MTHVQAPMPISQIAIVVKDIHAAMKAYHETLGWGPWNVYEHKPPSLHHAELHGEPAEYTMIGAETHVGPIVVELLQPVEGPSIYKEWLETKGEGLHHIACMAPTQEESDAIKERFAAMGAKVMMGGRLGQTIEYYYLDTEPMLKVIIESGTGHAVDLTPAYVYPEAGGGRREAGGGRREAGGGRRVMGEWGNGGKGERRTTDSRHTIHNSFWPSGGLGSAAGHDLEGHV